MFKAWSQSGGEFATADIVRSEFLVGVHAVVDAVKRRRGEQFYAERIAGMVSLSNDPQDNEAVARMAGGVRRQGKGAHSVVDGIAIRAGATVLVSG